MRGIREGILWYKTRRLAASHPFFRRPKGLLSRREAKRLLGDDAIFDGQAVIQQVRVELGIPVSAATEPPRLGKGGFPLYGAKPPSAWLSFCLWLAFLP